MKEMKLNGLEVFAATSSAAIIEDRKHKKLFVVFRGTDLDHFFPALGDLFDGATGWHGGNNRRVVHSSSVVEAAEEKARKEGYEVILSGHSLGAVIAKVLGVLRGHKYYSLNPPAFTPLQIEASYFGPQSSYSLATYFTKVKKMYEGQGVEVCVQGDFICEHFKDTYAGPLRSTEPRNAVRRISLASDGRSPHKFNTFLAIYEQEFGPLIPAQPNSGRSGNFFS